MESIKKISVVVTGLILLFVSSCSLDRDESTKREKFDQPSRSVIVEGSQEYKYKMNSAYDIAGGPRANQKSKYLIRGDRNKGSYWIERWTFKSGSNTITPYTIEVGDFEDAGYPVTIAVTKSKSPDVPQIWVTTSKGRIYQLVVTGPWGGYWEDKSDGISAKDITCHEFRNNPWVISEDGKSIYLRNGGWVEYDTPVDAGVLVSIETYRPVKYDNGILEAGLPWVTNTQGLIFEMVPDERGFKWINRSNGHKARDIGIGHRKAEFPEIYMVGGEDYIGRDIYKWNHEKDNWDFYMAAEAERISVDYDHSMFYTDKDNKIYFEEDEPPVSDWAGVVDSCKDIAPSPNDKDLLYIVRSLSDQGSFIDVYNRSKKITSFYAYADRSLGYMRRMEVIKDSFGEDQIWCITKSGIIYKLDNRNGTVWVEEGKGLKAVDIAATADNNLWILDDTGRGIYKRNPSTGNWVKEYSITTKDRAYRLAIPYYAGSQNQYKPWIRTGQFWHNSRLYEFIPNSGNGTWKDRTMVPGRGCVGLSSSYSKTNSPSLIATSVDNLYRWRESDETWNLINCDSAGDDIALTKEERVIMICNISKTTTIGPISPIFDDYPVWEVGATYKVGDIVIYQGMKFKCLQGHTVYDPNWNPKATPALWQPI